MDKYERWVKEYEKRNKVRFYKEKKGLYMYKRQTNNPEQWEVEPRRIFDSYKEAAEYLIRH